MYNNQYNFPRYYQYPYPYYYPQQLQQLPQLNSDPNYNYNYNFHNTILQGLEGLKTETEQMKLLFSVNRNDLINVNNYIDKSIKEMEKMSLSINNSNQNMEKMMTKINSYDSRINNAFKEIKKIKKTINKSNNDDDNDDNDDDNQDDDNQDDDYKDDDYKDGEKKSYKNKKSKKSKYCCNHNMEQHSESEDDGNPIVKTITIGIPTANLFKNMSNAEPPKVPFLNILSTLFKNGEEQYDKKKETNDLIDSEDDIDDTFDIYDTSNIKNKKIKNLNDIELNIKSIDDLIELGLKYKLAEIKKPNKNSSSQNIPKNNITLSSPFINQDNKGNHMNDLSKIIMSRILNKTISKIDNINKDKKDKIDNINQDNQENTDSNDSTEIKSGDKKIKPYYRFNGQKYLIDLEKIVKLIEPLQKLKRMIGMTKVKEHIVDLILYYIQGFENSTKDMLHTSVEGPPGVGKTRLGRILAQIYSALGVIPSSRFKRVRRTDLIGKYLGHTAHKTQEVIDEAEGGVLFIDEAYSLGNADKEDIYAKECIDTINMNLTEKKKNLIVIIAGYTDQLDKSFFALNEGLKRRFPFRFQIDGYDENELTDIFYSKIRKIKWKLEKELSKEYLNNFFKQEKDKFKNFGGDIETVIMNCKMIHAKRVLGKSSKYKKILSIEDLQNAFKKFVISKKEESMNDSVKMMYQ